jgi:phosphate transport system permease protein
VAIWSASALCLAGFGRPVRRESAAVLSDKRLRRWRQKWQTIWYHLLPYSLGGIATGTIIAMSRALGESAPLIVVGAAGWLSDLPASPLRLRYPLVSWLNSDFTVLPIQMFTWSGDPDPAFQHNAAAAGLVLILLTLSMNGTAIWLRYRVQQKLKW